MGRLTSEQTRKLLGAEKPVKLKAKTVEGKIAEGLALWTRRKGSASDRVN